MKFLKAIALSLLGVLAVEKSALAINLYVPPEDIRTSTLYFENKVTQAGLFYCNTAGKNAAVNNFVVGYFGYYLNLNNKPEIKEKFISSSVAMTVANNSQVVLIYLNSNLIYLLMSFFKRYKKITPGTFTVPGVIFIYRLHRKPNP